MGIFELASRVWIGKFILVAAGENRLAVDIGFSALLDRFEHHFGTNITKIVLGSVGAAVSATCLGIVWNFVYPILTWTNETATSSTAFWLIGKILWYIFTFWTLVFGAFTIASSIDSRHMIKKLEAFYSDSADLFDRAAQILDDSSEIMKGATGLNEDKEAIGALDDQDIADKIIQISTRGDEASMKLRGFASQIRANIKEIND